MNRWWVGLADLGWLVVRCRCADGIDPATVEICQVCHGTGLAILDAA